MRKKLIVTIVVVAMLWTEKGSPQADLSDFEAPPTQTPPKTEDGSLHGELRRYFGDLEYDTILEAANRNECKGDDFILLLAIRKSENGRDGIEFGVKHPRAVNTNLDVQAGWAAATVVKNRKRFDREFIEYLGGRYAPVGSGKDNKYWVRNVTWWYEKLKGESK